MADFAIGTMQDFYALERRARIFVESGRIRDAIAVYYAMGDGDPSLDAGYLANRLGECYEAMGELHAARYWYGRAVEENPGISKYQEARKRLDGVSFDALPSD
jgi:tetratricopeptide (TPR) repeat protein